MALNNNSVYTHHGRRKYLTENEERMFLENVVKLPRSRALFCLTIYYTGCRISEILDLRWNDLDQTSKALTIRSLKKRRHSETRRIPIPDYLVEALCDDGSSIEDKNFRIWTFSRTSGWRVVKNVMQAASISGVHATSKGLRHGFGVRCALRHVPLNVIQRWMGHADPKTTSIYLDMRGEEERALITRTW